MRSIFALSGKTTSLVSLFSHFGGNNKINSIQTTTGRTLFFDFCSLILKSGEWKVKILLYTATGQDFYAATRAATLIGSDGIIFLIDSQKEFLEDNIRSWKELNYYYSEHIFDIPIVFCLNKRDLPMIINKSDLLEGFRLQNLKYFEIQETIALKGDGVQQAFETMLKFIFPNSIIKLHTMV